MHYFIEWFNHLLTSSIITNNSFSYKSPYKVELGKKLAIDPCYSNDLKFPWEHRGVFLFPFQSFFLFFPGGFPGGSDSKESAYSAGHLGSIPGSGRFPGEGKGNSLHYSCLENPIDGGAWQATVRGVPKSWTRRRFHFLSFLSFFSFSCYVLFNYSFISVEVRKVFTK